MQLTHQHMLEIIQADKDGKPLQYRLRGNLQFGGTEWGDCGHNQLNSPMPFDNLQSV